jgi:urea transport system permease protein
VRVVCWICLLVMGWLPVEVAKAASATSVALTSEQALVITTGEADARIAGLNAAVSGADTDTAKLLSLLEALAQDEVKVAGKQVYLVKGDKAIDAVSGASSTLPAGAEDVVSNNRLRSEYDAALAALRLGSKEPAVRLAAVQQLLKEPDATKLAAVEKALAAETDANLKIQLANARGAMLLSSENKAQRLEAVVSLAAAKNPGAAQLLSARLEQETDADVKAKIASTLAALNKDNAWGERAAVVFTGLSLSSVLLLAALGLAITYGLMGVINMAHGELIMVGAYATYWVQTSFRQWAPGAFDAYLLVALPASFLVAALVGVVMERLVLRHLYGRPLESLLATWGISLILMQLVRTIFGAQNVAVENPSWMSGGWAVLPNLTLPYNRLVIIVFAGLVVLLVATIIGKTRLGLFVRGVTQNRTMASCMGVNTAQIDTWAFALGSGIAGLAGCALSQIGNVGPDLGQNYIVDSFMVVVLGGVGQLIGTVYAALGLGVLNKLLEGWQGAVLAKIMVLVFIILFIQKRPQGLFALKGRSAE